MKNSKEPVIKFIGYKINRIDYNEIVGKDVKSKKTNINLKITCNLDKGIGTVIITSTFFNENPSDDNFGVRKCELKMTGAFKIRNDLSFEEARKYLATNGAAMLYPYVRTTISILVSLDAPENVIMPSINFLEAYNESMDNKTEEIEFDDFNPRVDGEIITAYSHEDDKTYEFSLYLSDNDYGDASITIDSHDDESQSRTINEAFNRNDVITSDSPTEEELNLEKKLEDELKSNVEEQIKEMIHEMIEE